MLLLLLSRLPDDIYCDTSAMGGRSGIDSPLVDAGYGKLSVYYYFSASIIMIRCERHLWQVDDDQAQL